MASQDGKASSLSVVKETRRNLQTPSTTGNDSPAPSGGAHDVKQHNPFKMPTDDEIFSLRDDERARKEEERRRFLQLPVHEKTTWSSRASFTSKQILEDSGGQFDAMRSLSKSKKLRVDAPGTAAAADFGLTGPRQREKENMTELVERKRHMFLVKGSEWKDDSMQQSGQSGFDARWQMSINTKEEEIERLDKQARRREEVIRHNEELLDRNRREFEEEQQKFDREAEDKMKEAETVAKKSHQTQLRIRELNQRISSVMSERAKYKDLQDECDAYKRFLDALTPQEYVEAQIAHHHQQIDQKRAQRRAEREARQQEEDVHLQAELDRDMEELQGSRRKDQKAVEKRQAEFESEMRRRQEERDQEDADDQAWDPDEGQPWEIPMYFERPQQLLEIFGAKEKQNLFQIQVFQETEEQLEELKRQLEATEKKKAAESEQLEQRLLDLRKQLEAEERRAEALRERKLAGQSEDRDAESQLAALKKRVAAVYERCGFEPDSSLSVLMMLFNMEEKLEDHLKKMALIPPAELEIAEKNKDRQRRTRLRDEKSAIAKKLQEERIAKSIERSKAPVQRKSGKPLMFRAPPQVRRRRDKEVQEERDSEEEDIREFLTED